MGSTSSEVKRRYNSKVYKQFNLQIKTETFEKYESLRGDMSRSEWLDMLVNFYYSKNSKK